MSLSLRCLPAAAALLLLLLMPLSKASPGAGYHYQTPQAHFYPTVSTVAPIPPVPALPPLPTARGPLQSFGHGHPATHSIAAAYRPAHPQQQYLPPSAPQHVARPAFGQRLQPAAIPTAHGGHFGPPSAPAQHYGRPIVVAPSAPSAPGALYGAPPSNFYGPSLGHDAALYQANGRQLKQYAVFEHIDNDIEPSKEPFLTRPFFDHIRARVGASGTGALPPLPGVQLSSRADAVLLNQQRLVQSVSAPTDPISLGSGGLGFVRLSNGNVLFGSGSLAYISSQQHSQFVQDARTRTGGQPDALHFGHGPLGGGTNGLRFK